jgi:hypothetical protein
MDFWMVYLAVGGLLVAHGWVRGLYLPYLAKRKQTILRRNKPPIRYDEPVRLKSDWAEFFGAQAFDLFFWPVPLLFWTLVGINNGTEWLLTKIHGG